MKKSYFLFTLSMLFTTAIFTQPRIVAQANIGGSGNDNLVNMCHTADGGLLAAGTSNSNKSFYKSQNNKGSYDYWIVKSVYDKTTGKAVEQWNKTIGGDSTDILVAAVPTRDGGFIVGGNSISGKSGNKTDTSHGGYDLWLVKTDGNGKVTWDKTIGGNTNDYLISMDTTNDGGYVLLYFYEPSTAGSNRNALIRLDAAGNVVLRKDTIGFGNTPFYESVHSTRDGGYVFAADSASKHVMIKTDAYLNEQWKAELGNSGYTSKYEAKELRNGSYVLFGYDATGYYIGSSEDDPDFFYDYYVNIFKTDHTGKQLWSLNRYADYYSISRVPFEELSTGGYLYGYDYNTKDHYWFDFLVNKIDNSGKQQWTDSIKTLGNSGLADIKEAAAGIYVYGSLSYVGIGADKTKISLGGSDYWFIEVKDTSTTNAPVIATKIAAPLIQKQALFKVYPNPAKDQLHVQVDGIATVSLMDANGKIIVRQIIQNSSSINVEKLPAGIYYLKNESTNTAKKVIITK